VAKLINKKIYKKAEGKCRICGETDYDLLNVHRIIPGCDSGKYLAGNTVCLCLSCHRKVHTGRITILGWHNSTKGKILHLIEENGEENFI